MKKYTSMNILTGWIVFAIAAITYLLTLEPTASFWDCGEFIAASYKLEVGHPPGAPFFLMVGRLFTLFAGSNTELVALMVNALSGLASAFTILFLFWTITHLAKKMLANTDEEPGTSDRWLILGSGVIGSLAYTFSDTFWFSAVEGEVYASSSLFTAIVFWAILKWENIADEKYANRWLVFIAYLMGLSIGVHLLNLLAIPAIVLIYYFKKYPITRNGVLMAIGASAVILGGIMYVLIPGFIHVATWFELFFINVVGMPYFSGLLIYLAVLIGAIIFGIWYTHKHQKVLANTAILMVTVIIIGYASYAQILIRSQANPPMDQNNPENLFNLLSYLNREQYGDRPLIYGQSFNAQIVKENEGKAIYYPEDGKYKVIAHKPDYKYDSKYNSFFPRMYSNQPKHVDAYMQWAKMDKGDYFEVRRDKSGREMRDRSGQIVYETNSPTKKPNMVKNISFFMRYQMGYMYFRYFMWNFSGRQNDVQGHYKDEINKGNWITGAKFIDSARLGNQKKLTPLQKNNRAFNKYFMLPLILGLIGMFSQYKNDVKNFWVVTFLFFLTGIAIVIYLNQTPHQPRERDYAYAGSFYAFAIWIGLAVIGLYKAAREVSYKFLSNYAVRGAIVVGVLAVFDLASNGSFTFTWAVLFALFLFLLILLIAKMAGGSVQNNTALAGLLVVLCLPVPALMAVENWDDHDRSGRYIARDMAYNYLNSCDKNAILYSNGDNDTFPLWYAQEVEGIRTDVRVINLSYLSADWYIEQMLHRAYESDPVRMQHTTDQYRQGHRDIVYLYDRVKGHVNLPEAIDFVANDAIQSQKLPGVSEMIYYIPQHKFRFKADSALVFGNGTIDPHMADKYVPELRWEIKKNYLTKNHLMALDFLASNNWERPINYAITVGSENYLGLDAYFEMNGLAYRVIPAEVKDGIGFAGGINTQRTYQNLIHTFRWGGIEEGDVYLDENCMRMFSNMRHNFANLAHALVLENKLDSAQQVIARCMELFPNDVMPFDLYMLSFVSSYYEMDRDEEARELAQIILDNTYAEFEYFLSLGRKYQNHLSFEKRVAAHIISELIRVSHEHDDKAFSASIDQRIQEFGPGLNAFFR